MILLAVLSGFIAAIFAPLLSWRLRDKAGWILALLPAGLAVYFAVLLLDPASEPASFLYRWVPELGIELSLRADGLGLLFALLISGIGALVIVYSGGYLRGSSELNRLYIWLLVFMASMLGVVLADNLLLLYVFWELTSLSSFLLIGFEHERAEARSAALQALLVTSAGGLALLAGLVLLGQTAGTFQISALLGQGDAIRASPAYLPILALVLLGAFTKSAQFPFHFWLPGAMEAPSPVSAYLHSATMVKAGIFLLARFHLVLGGTQVWQFSLVGIGLVTMLLGAYQALNKTDLKLILAYSTVSALGTITMLLGLEVSGAVQAAMVFLFAHALYKGALFLLAGTIQHETGTRNVEELGGLMRYMPITAVVTGLAALSLAGFGPVSGFIGKELLFETLLEDERLSLLLTPAAVLAGAVNVAVALILTVRPFTGPFRPTPKKPHPAPVSLWLGPALLAGAGLIFGLFPARSGQAFISPAVDAVLGEPYDEVLALWHGLNPALGLSLAAILLGTAAYLAWNAWRRRVSSLDRVLSYGPQWWYQQGLQGMNSLARAQTSILQSGYLRSYLLVIVISTVSLAGFTVLQRQGFHWPEEVVEIHFYDAALGFIILVATFFAVRSPSRLSAVAALGVVGYSIALLFLLFGAPDLAMTQFLIESLTVILFVLAFYHLPHFTQVSEPRQRILHAIIALLAGGLMTALVLSVVGVNLYPSISEFFLENAVTLAHGRDIVNVILVDFRGFDTLGEITVLAITAVGVFALLKLGKDRESGKEDETERAASPQEDSYLQKEDVA